MRPELGKEYPEADEEQITLAIIAAIRRNLERIYKSGHINRQFHAKMHACIKGTFTVDPSLPADYQAGTFIAGKKYDCWARLSNGNSRVQDDRKADVRGFAMKLVGVDGPQMVNDISMPGSHDLLLVSYPTLMAATLKDFRKSIDAICNGLSGLVLFSINPTNWAILARILVSMKKHTNLFAIPYWSVSPYRFGADGKAIKYKLVPTTQNLVQPLQKSPGFLQETIVADIAKQDITFDLMVQFQEDAVRDSIEDPTKEWKSPFHKIGKLVLPQQQFVPQATQQFGDNLTYSPWHCSEAHRPMGSVNKARQAVYDAISKFRVEHNLTAK